jgi:hypothetical protein
MRRLLTITLLVAAAALSLASAQQLQQQSAPATPYGQDPSGCDVACAHYLDCKGIHDDFMYSQCIGGCQQQGVTHDQSAQYAALDCPTAIQLVDSQGGMGGSGGGAPAAPAAGASGPQPGDKECQGCKRWDDLCQYVVETATGSGPYSGAVTECPQSCCP